MKLSIVIPVYNSEGILESLNKRIFEVIAMMELTNNFEVILINDHSNDDSWIKIKNLSKHHRYIKGINLNQNYGQHNAIMAGLNNCSGEFVITIDDDLQHPPEFFPEVLKQLSNHDVCYTNYNKRKHLFWKKAVSKLNNLFSSFLLSKPLSVYMSSFRGLKKSVVKEIIKYKYPNVYLDGLILRSTKNIGMINVDHHARKVGDSNYTLKKLLILWSNMLWDFSFLPFRPASIFGISLKYIIKFIRKENIKNQYEIIEKINFQ